MNYAVILAGGEGSRMDTPIPKQFLIVGRKPILIHTLENFVNNSNIDYIIVVCIDKYIEEARKIIKFYFKDKDIVVISGGINRNDSILKGLEYINYTYGLNDKDIIITHDSVRPFLTNDIINNNLKMCVKYGAVTTAIKAIDTILVSEDSNIIKHVPKRETMYHAQTPQTFKAKDLFTLINKENNLNKYTDLCGLYIKYNKKVHIVKGEQNNFKITTRDDLDIANNLVID